MDHNYRLTISDYDDQIYLDADTCQPYHQLDIKLKVLFDAQHDGHPWTERDIRMAEHELIERVMNKLRLAVTGLVNKTNPFGCHGY